MSKIGIKTEVIKSGKHKDIGSAFRSMEKEEREMLQGVMDNVHEQFMKAVAVGRKLDMEDVRKIADGRIFTGEQAIQFGLVDEIGTLDDAISEAALLVGIKGEPEIVTKEDRFSLLDILNNKLPKELGSLLPVLKIKYLYLP